VVEVCIISAVIYILLGAPGFPLSFTSTFTLSENDKADSGTQTKIESLVYPSPNLSCPTHQYTVHLLSGAPLVVYIDGFLSEAETNHIVSIR